VLPHVEQQQRDRAHRLVVLLIVEGQGVETARDGIVDQCAPTRSLDRLGGFAELGAEAFEGTEVLVDSGSEFAIGRSGAARGEVSSEDQ
jgi:hypothetical protein